MTLIPKDMTPVYKPTIAEGTNAMRWQRAADVDLLPPCNNACPAGLNIQVWLSRAGRPIRRGLGKYMEDNALPATHGRACYHPCESACNRQFLDQPVAVHSLDRLLDDLAIEKGWTIPAGAPTGKRVLVIGAGPAGLSLSCCRDREGRAFSAPVHTAGSEGETNFGSTSVAAPKDVLGDPGVWSNRWVLRFRTAWLRAN